MGPGRELLYLDLALENTVRAAAERGSGASGTGAAALMAPLLQNLVLSAGDNEELAYCLKAWQALPDAVKTGRYPAKDEALKACALLREALLACACQIASSCPCSLLVDMWLSVQAASLQECVAHDELQLLFRMPC